MSPYCHPPVTTHASAQPSIPPPNPDAIPQNPATTPHLKTTQHYHTMVLTRSTPSNHNPYHNHHYHTRQRLMDWLSTACKVPTAQKAPPMLNSTSDSQPPHPQQQLLLPTILNKAWGDAVETNKPPHLFRILSKNVNTLSAADDFADWKGVAQACADYGVTVACFQETNLQWSPPLIQRVHKIFQSLPKRQAKIATSNSSKVTPSNYQLGGTCTAVIGRWTSHVRMAAQDHHGMGRWSSIKFEGRNARRIVVVTGYRSCNQQA